ncbi:MAG: cytidylate kinase family protein, partial [Armatimonadota bacterium]
ELEGISEREARQKVARLDAQRRAFAKAHFRLDSSDPTLYDLVINTERTTLEQAATLIVTAARYRQTAVKEA